MKIRKLSVLIPIFLWTACAPPGGEEEASSTGAASQALIGGRASGAEDDHVLALFRDSAPQGNATLIAPNLVLVSRGQVQEPIERGGVDQTCVDYGISRTGLSVARGLTSAPESRIPIVRIVTDGSPSSCRNDLAILELAAPLEGIPIARMRLDEGPKRAEPVRVVGWGAIDTRSTLPTTRQTLDGEVLLEAGGEYQLQTSTFSFDPAFVLTDVAACVNDGGGAILDQNGDLLGIISGLVPQDFSLFNPIRPAETCPGSFSYGPPVASHRRFIERILQGYGYMPWRVGQAEPPRTRGATCEQNWDCNSNLCIDVGGVQECSAVCSTDDDCGGGASCLSMPIANVCVTDVVDPPEPSNCQASTATRGGRTAGAAAGLLIVAAALAGRRARVRVRRP